MFQHFEKKDQILQILSAVSFQSLSSILTANVKFFPNTPYIAGIYSQTISVTTINFESRSPVVSVCFNRSYKSDVFTHRSRSFARNVSHTYIDTRLRTYVDRFPDWFVTINFGVGSSIKCGRSTRWIRLKKVLASRKRVRLNERLSATCLLRNVHVSLSHFDTSLLFLKVSNVMFRYLAENF